MADNKIVHRISLEGADKVSKQLQSIGLEGENAFKKVKQSAESSSIGDKTGEAFGGKSEAAREAAERFREVLHTLHPVLSAAGIEIADLGAYARLAGAGMGALGAAIVGSVLVGLAKLGDEADKAKRRLDLLSGAGKGGGDSQYEGLKKTARDLGVNASDLDPAAETLFRSQQNSRASERTVVHPDNFVAGPNEEAANNVQVFRGGEATPSAGLSSATINAAIKAVGEAGRLDRTAPKDSTAALAALYGSTNGGKGQITVDAYDALVKAAPSIGDAVAKAASGSSAGGVGQALPAGAPDLRAFLQRGGKLTGDQVLTGLARAEPDLREKAEGIPPGVTEALDHLEAAAKRVAEAFAGDIGIAGAVEKIAKAIDDAADNIDKTIHPRDYEPGGPKFVGPVSEAENANYKKPSLIDLGKTLLTGDSDPRFADSNAAKAAKFLRDGPQALQKTPQDVFGPTVDFLQKALTAPQTIEGNTPEPSPPLHSPLTREKLGKTIIPSPLETFFPKQPVPSPEPHDAAAIDLTKAAEGHEKAAADLSRAAGDLSKAAGNYSEATSKPDFGSGQRGETSPPVAAAPAAPAPSHVAPEYVPPPQNEFQYIPPPSPDEQRRLDQDRLGPLPPQVPPTPAQTQPVLPPQQFGQADQSFQTAELAPLPPIQQGPLPPQPPAIVQDAAGLVQNLINSLSERLNGPENRKIDTPTDAIGIRGQAAPVGDDAAKAQLADLGAAAEDVAAKLRGIEAPAINQGTASTEQAAQAAVQVATGGSVRKNMDDGGHVSGPGTSTSDSIPAMLSDGEYVIKASSARKAGRSRLDQWNAGNFADGGEVIKLRLAMVKRFAAGGAASDDNGVTRTLASETKIGSGQHEVTFDPATGGAFVDGTLHLPGDPILNDPAVQKGIAESKSGMNQQPAKSKYKSEFVGRFGHSDDEDTYVAAGGPIGHFAQGGSVGRTSSGASSFASRLSDMGLSSIEMPHLAVGGMPDIPTPDLSKSDLAQAGPSGGGLHPLTMNFPWGDKVAGLHAEPSAMKQLSRAANSAKRFSTGPKPGWYGGNGR